MTRQRKRSKHKLRPGQIWWRSLNEQQRRAYIAKKMLEREFKRAMEKDN